jgi:secreted PhoX family phosphatase
LGEILASAYIVRTVRPSIMPDVDNSAINAEEKQEVVESIESRRKFLKISVAAGATAAALAAGVHFMPALASAGKEMQSKTNLEDPSSSQSSNNPLIVVIKDAQLDIYEGENKFTSHDVSFARSITASVRARM